MESASLETANVYRATEIVLDEDVLSLSFRRDAEQVVSPLALVLLVGVIGSWARRLRAPPLTATPKGQEANRGHAAGDADA